jgi:hypothetical protein
MSPKPCKIDPNDVNLLLDRGADATRMGGIPRTECPAGEQHNALKKANATAELLDLWKRVGVKQNNNEIWPGVVTKYDYGSQGPYWDVRYDDKSNGTWRGEGWKGESSRSNIVPFYNNNQRMDVAKRLLDEGADPNAVDDKNKTALDYAVCNSKWQQELGVYKVTNTTVSGGKRRRKQRKSNKQRKNKKQNKSRKQRKN